MLTQTICDLYRHLPVSVLIFKNKQLIHINKHLFEMFCIDDLVIKLEDIKEELHYCIFNAALNSNIKNDLELYEELLKNTLFSYKQKQIQIDIKTMSDYSIVVLSLFKSFQSNEVIEKRSNFSKENKILDIFSRTTQNQFHLFSMYKGLHIQSQAQLIEVNNSELIFHVSKKHFSSYLDNNEYIISPNNTSENVIIANAIYLNRKQYYLHLSNLDIISKSAKDRRTIRVKCMDEVIKISINNEHTYQIYDLSLYALSILTDTEDNTLIKDDEISYLLNFSLIYNKVESNINIDAKVEKVMHLEKDNTRKLVLSFSPNDHARKQIKNYINFRQLEILRELKQFTETVNSL